MSLLDRLTRALAPRYRVEGEIGRGGMGAVFRALDTRLERLVAIKVLPAEMATAVARERFVREARVMARLHHPNIVPVYDADETAEGDAYYTMELMPGPTLAKRLESGRLSVAETVALGRQVLDALAHAHRAGIVHRDVKPSNIFFDEPRVLLGDFGVAQTESDSLTGTGGQVGTPGYWAPEQAVGLRATARSDIYSLGLVLREAATGEGPNAPATSPVDLPPALGRAIGRALKLEPDARWSDAESFGAALEPAPWYRRRWVMIGGVAAGGMLVTSLLAMRLWRDLMCPPLPPQPASGISQLAILPFTDDGDGSLGRRMARSTGAALEWFPPVSIVPLARAFAWWDSVPAAQRGLGAARALGARLYAEGRIEQHAEGFVLRVELRDSTAALQQMFEVAGDTARVISWAQAVADTLVRKEFETKLTDYRALGHSGTRDQQALRDFFAGEDAFERDKFGAAAQHYRRALDRDPQFTQAAWALMLVGKWRRDSSFEISLADLHGRAAALPSVFAALVETEREPDLRRRLVRFEQLASMRPRIGPAVFMYVGELFHRGALVGRPGSEAVRALLDGARDVPYLDRASVYEQAAWGSIHLGDQPGATHALALQCHKGQGDYHWGPLLRLAIEARFRPWVAAVANRVVSVGADSSLVADIGLAVRLASTMDIPAEEVALGRIVARRGATPALRGSARVAQAIGLMQLGRMAEGLAQLDSANGMSTPDEMVLQRAEWRLVPAAFGFPVDTTERANARAWLQNTRLSGAHRARADWALLLDGKQRGDSAEVAVRRAALVGSAVPAGQWLASLAIADSLASSGALDSAMAWSAVVFMADSAGLAAGPFARASGHLLRGEWEAQRGDREAADREWLWYENADLRGWPAGEPQQGEADGVLSVYARLLRGKNRLLLGDTTAACHYLTRARQLWSGADPGFAPLRKQVEEAARPCR